MRKDYYLRLFKTVLKLIADSAHCWKQYVTVLKLFILFLLNNHIFRNCLLSQKIRDKINRIFLQMYMKKIIKLF